MSANEHTTLVQRYINFAQFFGLAPISVSPNSAIFSISTMKFAMSVICLLLQVGHGIFQVMKMFNEIHLTTMSSIIHNVWMFHCLLTNVFVAIQSLLVSKHLVAYLNQLCKIDHDIQSKLHFVMNHKRQCRKHFLIATFVTTFSMTLSWILYGLVALLYPKLISLFAFIFIPYGFMSVRNFQIIHSIELLNDHLDVINVRLANMAQMHGKRNLGDGENGLIVLRRLYGQCWNAMERYNVCFGFSNLMLLLFYSVDVLHGVYTLFLNMHRLRRDLVILCEYHCQNQTIP